MYGRGPQTIVQQYSCGSLTSTACIIHGNRSALHICYDNILTRKEGGSIESGYHPKVIGRMGMVRKSVGVLGVGMRVSDGIPLIVMRMDKQRIAHIEPYEQGHEQTVQKAVFSQPFYHNAQIYAEAESRTNLFVMPRRNSINDEVKYSIFSTTKNKTGRNSFQDTSVPAGSIVTGTFQRPCTGTYSP